MSLYPRFIQAKVEEALLDTPVVCLLGPRQVGKSTLCQQLAPERSYLTLDDHATLAVAKGSQSALFKVCRNMSP